MSVKKIKEKPPVRTATSAPAARPAGLKPWQKDLIACAAIFLAVFVMFREVPLGGKIMAQGDDTAASMAMDYYARHESNVREYPLWCPYIFGGFPGLASGAYASYNYMGFPYSLASKFLSPTYWAQSVTDKLLLLGILRSSNYEDDIVANEQRVARWLVSFFIYIGLFTYLMMRGLGFQPLLSVIPSMAMAWNPYLISLITASHGSKFITFAFMPLIVLLAWRLYERRHLLEMALLAMAFGLQISLGGHTQVLFYSVLTIFVLYLFWAIFEVKQGGEVLRVLKAGGMTLAAGVLGFGMGSVFYIPLAEFVNHSIRGLGPAIAAAGGSPQGYTMADATMWSFHPQEILTFIVPSWFGLKSPYYWGTMPFTSSSFYFGVVPFLFAVLAFFGKKDRLFWSLLAVSVFSLLLSFGSHFETFYAIFFNVLPFFNKFRTPSLIILLVVLAGIVFTGYGLRFVLNLPQDGKWPKRFLYGALICAGLFALVLVTGDALSGLFGSYTKAGDAQRYSPEQLGQIRAMRFDMLKNDLLIALVWLALAFAAAWAYLTRRIKSTVFLAAILVITVIDLWRFSGQFFESKSASTARGILEENEIVRTIRADNETFRVMPLGNRLMQDNRWAAWEIPSLGGYHGAKMRSYQDMLDNVMFASPDRRLPLNMGFLSAMNVKYFVAEGQLPPALNVELVKQDPATGWHLYNNPRVKPRVYFADSIVVSNDRTETVRRVADPTFLWGYIAVVDKPLPGSLEKHPDRRAEITSYTPHLVRMQVSAPTPSFLVFSDAYYEPGWTALDNGSPSRIYQVNGFVRGLYVYPGEHSIEFRYTGKREHAGIATATVSHFLVWGLVIGALWWEYRRRRKTA